MKIRQWLFKILRKQNVTDGRMDGRTDARTQGHTDARTHNVKTVYPPQTKFAGGIKIKHQTLHSLENAMKWQYLKLHNLWYCYILSETSKPPLDIFSYILTYMIHTWLKFTLNMEKSIKQNLSKFHFLKLKTTCSVDRLYKGTIAFHFHTNARSWVHRLITNIQGA